MSGIFSILLKFISLALKLEEPQSFPPPLKKEVEAELFEKMAGGDKEARNKLIEHNLRLVSHIIRKYYASYENPDELLSIGSIGLIKAIDTFSNKYGTKFATYGAKCVQNEILMFFRGRKKTANEISINETIDIDKDGNPLTYLDIIGIEDSIAENVEMKIYTDRLRELVDEVLDEREKLIVILRYGLKGYRPMTQKDVASYLGISRSYVSRIEKRALEILKNSFGKDVPDLSE